MLKKPRNHSKLLKLQQNIKICHKFTQQGALRTLHIQFFSQLTLLSNNLVLTSYLSGIYLESWFSWLWGWRAENIEKKKKTDRRKTMTSEEKEKRRMQGKSNNNNIHLWF